MPVHTYLGGYCTQNTRDGFGSRSAAFRPSRHTFGPWQKSGILHICIWKKLPLVATATMSSKKKADKKSGKSGEQMEPAIIVGLHKDKDSELAAIARNKTIRQTAVVLYKCLTCVLGFALVALLHNLYRTERGSKDGYLGGDWWAEQIAMSTALTVWIIRRLVSPPLHANLEKMLEASERKARKGKKQK